MFCVAVVLIDVTEVVVNGSFVSEGLKTRGRGYRRECSRYGCTYKCGSWVTTLYYVCMGAWA